jgi:hypothetical protein
VPKGGVKVYRSGPLTTGSQLDFRLAETWFPLNVAFQMAEVANSRHLFADILRLIAELRATT